MKEGTRQFREIKRIVTECYQQLYVNKLDNLEEMDKFLETHCREITISQDGGGQALSSHVLSLSSHIVYKVCKQWLCMVWCNSWYHL